MCNEITRALAPEAKDRFASASEMRDALLACVPSSSALRSVVQSPDKRVPRLGQATQVLLESAGDPFADPDEAPFLPRFPVVRVALACLVVLAVGAAVWRSGASEATPVVTSVERAAGTHVVAAAPVPSLPALPPARDDRAGAKVAATKPAADAVATAPAELDLPIGADMPDEDLPVSIPAYLHAPTIERAEARTHEKRRERSHAAIPASAPTKTPSTASPSAQNGESTSSAGADRPIRQKVVRQLDF
jgi:hypothetical protein